MNITATLTRIPGALVLLLRLAFSRRARDELEGAARELDAAVNEVHARLARMSAEQHGARPLLRVAWSASEVRAGSDEAREV